MWNFERQPSVWPATWHFDKRLLTRISSSGGTYAGDYVSNVTYDALDRVLDLEMGGSIGSPVATETRSYDSVSGHLDRILASTTAVPSLSDLDYTIDGVGRVESLATITASTEARSFTYGYDGLDRLRTATGNFDADPLVSEALTYNYDALGNLETKDVGSGEGWGLAYQV